MVGRDVAVLQLASHHLLCHAGTLAEFALGPGTSFGTLVDVASDPSLLVSLRPGTSDPRPKEIPRPKWTEGPR